MTRPKLLPAFATPPAPRPGMRTRSIYLDDETWGRITAAVRWARENDGECGPCDKERTRQGFIREAIDTHLGFMAEVEANMRGGQFEPDYRPLRGRGTS